MGVNQRRLQRLLLAWLENPQDCKRDDTGNLSVPVADERRALMPSAMVDHAIAVGLLVETEERGWRPDTAAVHWCRREQARSKGQVDAAFGLQHRRMETRDMIDDDGEWIRVEMNLSNSPLTSLYRRRDQTGRSLINKLQWAAGERFREDYARSRMGAMAASNWEGLPSTHKSATGSRGHVTEMAMDARDRVMAALSFLGPELEPVAYAVLVHETSLSALEGNRHWPQGTARVLLQMSLNQLARHYGLISPSSPRSRYAESLP